MTTMTHTDLIDEAIGGLLVRLGTILKASVTKSGEGFCCHIIGQEKFGIIDIASAEFPYSHVHRDQFIEIFELVSKQSRQDAVSRDIREAIRENPILDFTIRDLIPETQSH
ncbi:hypothetical protein HK098_007992 [Nowakowskiella sp. JEL0407]|nr:hypothetical protein HK098_007992 [Nowakowskiella sp. JEL0407]